MRKATNASARERPPCRPPASNPAKRLSKVAKYLSLRARDGSNNETGARIRALVGTNRAISRRSHEAGERTDIKECSTVAMRRGTTAKAARHGATTPTNPAHADWTEPKGSPATEIVDRSHALVARRRATSTRTAAHAARQPSTARGRRREACQRSAPARRTLKWRLVTAHRLIQRAHQASGVAHWPLEMRLLSFRPMQRLAGLDQRQAGCAERHLPCAQRPISDRQ
jgi:hypothetical protein